MFFFSSRRRHTRFDCDWSSDVCSSDLVLGIVAHDGAFAEYLALPLENLHVVPAGVTRSEEHTSELQSQSNLVCRLLLEKKKKNKLCLVRYTTKSVLLRRAYTSRYSARQ